MDAAIRLVIEAQDSASQVVERLYGQVDRGRRAADDFGGTCQVLADNVVQGTNTDFTLLSLYTPTVIGPQTIVISALCGVASGLAQNRSLVVTVRGH
jgi:hypothetical protein